MYQPFFKKYLDKAKQSKLFLLSGDEYYFLDSSKRYLLDLFKEYPVITLNKPDNQQIEEELNSSDLFSDTKVIIIENYSPLTTTGKKIEDNAVASLLEHLKNTEHYVLLIQEEGLDKRKKLTKEIINITHHIDCSKLVKKEFGTFLEYLNSNYNLKLPKNLITELSVFLSEVPLSLINKEFEKLTLYPEEINQSNIYDLLSVSTQQKVFDLMDKILDKNIVKAIEIYDSLLLNKESEYKIYSFLSSQFTSLMNIKLIRADQLLIDIPKTLSIHPFVADKLEKSGRKFSLDELINAQSLLLDVDLKIKQGLALSQDAVRFLIISLSS